MTKKEPIFDVEKARESIETGKRGNWWQRRGSKSRGFGYFDKNGRKINDENHLERIKSLVIPPAWKYVRISPSTSGNLQVLGMDTNGRIQRLYNPKFREKQERKKFQKIEKFGEYLPKLRKITSEHLNLSGFPREKVLAAMIRLINSLYIRVGSEDSVEKYKTYGITTLQNRHLEVKRGGKLIFNFVGKHHIAHRKILVDNELAMLMRDLKAIGGARKLFNYLDENDKPRPIKPADINEYLKEITAPDFTAKDFRTWGGTLLAAIILSEIGAADDEKLIKKNIVKAIKKVAEHLGNTPAVARASYVHPAVLKSYEAGITLDEFEKKKKRVIKFSQADYETEEKALMKLFKSEN